MHFHIRSGKARNQVAYPDRPQHIHTRTCSGIFIPGTEKARWTQEEDQERKTEEKEEVKQERNEEEKEGGKKESEQDETTTKQKTK